MSLVCFVPAPRRVGASSPGAKQKNGVEFLYGCSPSLFSFPDTFKDLMCKLTVKLVRMPAVVQQLGTIHSVYSSAALRCTLMEQAEASFIIIIKHYFAVIGCFLSSRLKGALINCAARWEVGSCSCPCFTDEESGGLTHPVSCPRLCDNSPSVQPIPKCRLLPGALFLETLSARLQWQSSPLGVLRSSSFLYAEFGFG